MIETGPVEAAGTPAAGTPAVGIERDVSIADAVRYAVKLHRSGDLAAAEELYRKVLEAAPDTVDALHFYGLLAHTSGRSLEAIDLFRRALAIDPLHAGMHANFGNINVELHRFATAIDAYEAAIGLDPENESFRANLATVQRILAGFRENEERHRAAIDRDPADGKAWSGLARVLEQQGRFREALLADVKALELRPDDAEARYQLIAGYASIGETDRASALVREGLERRPDDASLRHLLASVSGAAVPERASDAYVVELFDDFAAGFDARLADIGYTVPSLIGRAVVDVFGRPEGRLDVLDAGCGTGLCGPHLRPYAKHLAGVDLSGKMLARAAARGGYDELVCEELTAFLQTRTGVYDLIACADTLCYFGDLQAVLTAMKFALRPDGILVFTVERHAPENGAVRLNVHGRYSHSAEHVVEALAAAGLDIVQGRGADLRFEYGEPVGGFLVTARRA